MKQYEGTLSNELSRWHGWPKDCKLSLLTLIVATDQVNVCKPNNGVQIC